MARLAKDGDERTVLVGTESLVGAGRAVDVRVAHPCSSSRHAMIEWTGAAWTIRDESSTNGTYLDGRRLPPGQPQSLKAGDRIWFGSPEEQWIVVDCEPPVAFATSEGRQVVGTSDFLALPDDDQPSFTVHREGDEGWIRATPAGEEVYHDGDEVTVDGRPWVLSLPNARRATATWEPAQRPLLDAEFIFHADRGEVDIALTVEWAEGREHFPPRSFWFTLLQYAELRQRHRDEGVPEREAGWISSREMAEYLGYNPNHILFHMHKCRQRLLKAGLRETQLFERRSVEKTMRFGPPRFRIIRG